MLAVSFFRFFSDSVSTLPPDQMSPRLYVFTEIPIGTNTEWGVIAICPHCGRRGAQATIEGKEFFTHAINFGIDNQGLRFANWDSCPSAPKPGRAVKMATDQTRCPYCVEGLTFRLLAPILGGELLMCDHCGHVAYPTEYPFASDTGLVCQCNNCLKLNPPHELS